MSADRLERRLPEVLTELSLPRVPDYVDNLLDRTARMPQRPGWTFLERWFPVSTLTATLSTRRQSLRPLIAVAILIALVMASIVWYVGSQRRPPPLFGPARNGVVVTNNAAGDLVSVDPDTGATRTLIAGQNVCCADVSPDGQRLAFLRTVVPNGDATGLAIANMDGSVVREFTEETVRGVTGFEWSPTGDRVLVTNESSVVLLDVATGQVTPISVPHDISFNISRASWIGTTGDILLTAESPGTGADTGTFRAYRLPAGATSGATEVATLAYTVATPLVSPDGSRLLYFIWGPETRLQGKLHVFDFATGEDRAVTPEDAQAPADITEWENPVWSPDGSQIAAELYTAGPNRVAVIPADGGAPVLVGPAFPTSANGAAIRFSPDGASLLVTYRFNNETWLLPVSGAEGRRVPWALTEDLDWQRLAP
jgi:sugar lactone lactonase YvrE